MMKVECLEIYKKVGEPHAPLKELAKGENILLNSYDASGNDYPEDCVYASTFDEIIEEKNLASQWKHNEIPVRRMYLWVLKDDKIWMIHEATAVNSKRGFACHSNITGGDDAIIGGELWFLKTGNGEVEVYLNFDSGRFTIRNVDTQYPLVFDLFSCVGYKIEKLVN